MILFGGRCTCPKEGQNRGKQKHCVCERGLVVCMWSILALDFRFALSSLALWAVSSVTLVLNGNVSK